MKKKILIASFFLISAVNAAVMAGGDHEMAPYEGSKEFQKIKALAGHWEGTSSEGMKPGEAPQKITVDYKVTSGGSAVVETLFAGTPHEMVSVYHDEAGALAMTHYCMMRNQPHMTTSKAAGTGIKLEAAKPANIDPQSCYMRSIEIETPAPDKLIQKWTTFDEGKAKGASTFEFTRKG